MPIVRPRASRCLLATVGLLYVYLPVLRTSTRTRPDSRDRQSAPNTRSSVRYTLSPSLSASLLGPARSAPYQVQQAVRFGRCVLNWLFCVCAHLR
eukprot:SAG31_NODE_7211_length_1754_cov_0.958912_2_plen_94_part_01